MSRGAGAPVAGPVGPWAGAEEGSAGLSYCEPLPAVRQVDAAHHETRVCAAWAPYETEAVPYRGTLERTCEVVMALATTLLAREPSAVVTPSRLAFYRQEKIIDHAIGPKQRARYERAHVLWALTGVLARETLGVTLEDVRALRAHADPMRACAHLLALIHPPVRPAVAAAGLVSTVQFGGALIGGAPTISGGGPVMVGAVRASSMAPPPLGGMVFGTAGAGERFPAVAGSVPCGPGLQVQRVDGATVWCVSRDPAAVLLPLPANWWPAPPAIGDTVALAATPSPG